jgi:Uma2 family endonuclease
MAASVATDLPIHRLDVDTYHRLARAGALDGMDVELLEGLLFDKDSSREDPIHRIDVGTYHRMVASGALEGLRIELLDGLLVEMSPKSPDHVVVVTTLMRYFAHEPRWWTQVQDPIEAAFDCEPEPDLVVASHRPPPGRHLRTALLVVEVAVSSHRLDRGRKAALYAAADIPTYWLVDVPGRTVEIRTEPGSNGYTRCEIYREGSVVPSPLDGVEDLDITALLADVDT